MAGKRFFGRLTIRLPDGYVEYSVIRERSYEKFLGRLQEALQNILKSGPEGNVKVNYKGDFAGALYEFMKRAKEGQSDQSV